MAKETDDFKDGIELGKTVREGYAIGEESYTDEKNPQHDVLREPSPDPGDNDE